MNRLSDNDIVKHYDKNSTLSLRKEWNVGLDVNSAAIKRL